MQKSMIKKDTVNRLVKDINDIRKNPLTNDGIYYIHHESNMLQGYALIIGPPDTPYFGGYYFFQINYPIDYPYSPPNVIYSTNGNNIRFNPNLYTSGKVCISILNTWSGEQWASCQSITSLLLSLLTLFIDNPLLNEPGVKNSNYEIVIYNKIIEYANLNIAVCDILTKNQSVYLPFFELFEDVIIDRFLTNYDQFILHATKKDVVEELKMQHYYQPMSAVTNYKKIIERLQTIHCIYHKTP